MNLRSTSLTVYKTWHIGPVSNDERHLRDKTTNHVNIKDDGWARVDQEV